MTAQETDSLPHYNAIKYNAPVGIGIGIDYGGLGVKMGYFPHKNIGLYGAMGYNLVTAGLSTGLTFRTYPSKLIRPCFHAIYGYNAVIKIYGDDKNRYDAVFYGPSIGFGFEAGKTSGLYLNMAVFYPFRDQEFYDEWNKIKNNSNIETYSEILPFTMSIGLHYPF
jgi:hypothetical protein